MKNFDYMSTTTADAARAAVLGSRGARFLAGGTTLVDLMKCGVEEPAALIDITRIPGLDTIEIGADRIKIGALAKMSAVARHPVIREEFPVLSESLWRGASEQLRNMATIGGNLLQRTRCSYFRAPHIYGACNKRRPGSGCAALGGHNRGHAILGTSEHCIATYPGDFAVALMAFDAVVHVEDGERRTIAIGDFFPLPDITPHIEHPIAVTDLIVGVTVWEPSQWVEGARRTLSEWFSVPFEKVRVLSPFVGGSFGSKVTLHPHSAIAAMAAKQIGRPVKLGLTRAQNFTAHGGRPATRQHLSLGASEDGRLRAILHNNVNETSIDDNYDESGEDLARVAYASPNFSARAGLVHANIITPGWMRAPGEAVGAYALECAMDELAYQLQMDPIELRLRNLADHDPESGKPWSTRRLREAYQAGAEAFGWAERSPEPRSMRRGSELVGWGMAGGCFRSMASRPRRASASAPMEPSR